MTPLARSALIAVIGVIAVGTAVYLIQKPLGTGGPPAASPTASPPALSIAGTWDAEFTHDQFVAAGLVDAAEDNAENWGHFRMVFAAGASGTSGAFHITQLDGPQSSGGGTYSTSGSTLTVHCSGWCDNDAVFVLSFTLTPTTLTIDAPGPATFRVEPWVRVTGAEPTTPPIVEPTDVPVVPATQLPDPAGAALAADLVGRIYRVNPAEIRDGRQLVLTLRAADDPHCVAMYGGRSTCFTVLYSPYKDDPGARGSARIVGGNLVLGFAIVPFDLGCVGQAATYAIEDGGATLAGINPPGCTFPGFVELP